VERLAGYITFSGAHRLLDAGINGQEQLKKINRSAISGIVISSIMRYVYSLQHWCCYAGSGIRQFQPAGQCIKICSREIGFRIFGVVLWSAAISSVLGAAYTSVSFLKNISSIAGKI